MTGTTSITIEQLDAINRLRESLNPSDREATRTLILTPASVIEPGARGFVRVKFDAGWGSISFDVNEAGESDQVNFGDSAISAAADVPPALGTSV